MTTLLLATLFSTTMQTQPTTDFSNSMTQAEVKFAEMNRSIGRILASRQSVSTRSQLEDENRRIVRSLQNLEGQLNKDYAGKSIKWDVQIAKSVLEAEKTGDVMVPSSIAGAIGKQLSMGGNGLAKKYVVSVRFDGSTPWAKGMTRGQVVTLDATIKSIGVTVDGVVVALAGALLRKKPVAGEQPVAGAPAKETFAEFAGKWKVTYDNKYTHEYVITADGSLTFVFCYPPNGIPETKEDEQKAQLTRKDGEVLVKFANGKLVERFSLVGDTLIVERFEPISLYPKTPKNKGLGKREK